MNRKSLEKTVDAYIARYPLGTRKLLKTLRAAIRAVAPKAEEKISYGMPAYMFRGRLAYFAGYRHHIGFYPMPGAIRAFQKELSGYTCAKGTVQFPLDKPLPIALIKNMVKFRMRENMKKA